MEIKEGNMILIDQEIESAVNTGEVEISDFSKECLMPASYDLRIGEEAFTLSAGRVIYLEREALEVQPGDFALVMTHEKLRLPTNMVGRFGLRSVFARRGLVLTGGLQVDPGFEGKLIVGLINFSAETITMSFLTPFCSLELSRLPRHCSTPYHGPYQGQEHITDEVIKALPQERFPLAVMLVRQLIATSPRLRARETPPSPRQRETEIFEREKTAFEKLKLQLLGTHRGQYAVVRDGKVVLFGHNKTELAAQAYHQFGYGPLYIGLIQEEPEVAYIPTPRKSG